MVELMKGVDISKAFGFDGVGNRMIKRCTEGFNLILNQMRPNYY